MPRSVDARRHQHDGGGDEADGEAGEQHQRLPERRDVLADLEVEAAEAAAAAAPTVAAGLTGEWSETPTMVRLRTAPLPVGERYGALPAKRRLGEVGEGVPRRVTPPPTRKLGVTGLRLAQQVSLSSPTGEEASC